MNLPCALADHYCTETFLKLNLNLHISKESIATTFLTKELMDYAGFYFEYTIFLFLSREGHSKQGLLMC